MDIKDIKKFFFAHRNGITADILRKAGMPYKIIFGLQIPQLSELARSIGYDDSLAEELWNDTEVRESRILALYLFDPEITDMEKAVRLTRETVTREEADMLAFRLLRRLAFAKEIAEAIDSDSNHPNPYASEALKRFL